MQINYYYDNTGNYSSDTEGSLVQLCDACALEAGNDVEFASTGDIDAICECCDMPSQGWVQTMQGEVA